MKFLLSKVKIAAVSMLALLLAMICAFAACDLDEGDSASDSDSEVDDTDGDETDGEGDGNEEQAYDVIAFAAPSSYTKYLENLTRTDEGATSTTESYFYSTTGAYYVGDDNAFKFKPTLTVLNPNATSMSDMYIETTDFELDVTVTLVTEEGTFAVDMDTTNDYVTYSNFEFDFTEEAVGKTFTLTMALAGCTEDYFGNALETYSMTVTVADGWNVYDALDLARMNIVSEDFNTSNYHRGTTSMNIFYDSDTNKLGTGVTSTIWYNYLSGLGEEDLNTPVNGIFLQNDITITSDDIPPEFIVSEEEATAMGCNYSDMVGSVRDWSLLYVKYIEGNDFTFNGNYFKVDTSQLKWGMTNTSNDGYYYSSGNTATKYAGHSTVFSFSGLRTDTTQVNSVTFCNVESIGNTSGILNGKDADGLNASGSLIFLKSMHANVKVDNCITKEYLIGYFSEITDSNYYGLEISDTKIFDCYNSGIYAWVSAKNSVTNCQLKRFGGAAVMCVCGDDAVSGGTTDNTTYAYGGITIDSSTVIESYVSGTEAWFALNNASNAATQLTALDPVFNGYNKTFLTNSQINLYSIMLDHEYLSSEERTLYLDFSYGSGTGLYLSKSNSYNSNATTEAEIAENYAYFINAFMSTTNYAYPVFMTNSGTLFFINSSNKLINLTYYLTTYTSTGTGVETEISFTDSDTILYIMYPMGSTVVALAVALSDYSAS